MKSEQELQKVVKRILNLVNKEDMHVADNLYISGTYMANIVTQSLDSLEEVREYCEKVKSMCLDIAVEIGLE